MTTRSRLAPEQHWIVRFLPLATLADAQNLVRRLREVDSFRLYVAERAALVVPAIMVIVVISIACAIGVVLFLADRHSLLALLGILLLPVTLVGSFVVQMYVFLSWLEGRALARKLGNRHRPAPGATAIWLQQKFGLDMGPFPTPVPWLLAALFLFAPLLLLAASWISVALVLIVLGCLMPVAYARFDR